MYFIDAVRVLLPPDTAQQPGFEDIWASSKPIPDLLTAALDCWRYVVVHKVLVLDQWMQAGQADTLRTAREQRRVRAVPQEVLEAMGVFSDVGTDDGNDDYGGGNDDTDLNLFVLTVSNDSVEEIGSMDCDVDTEHEHNINNE